MLSTTDFFTVELVFYFRRIDGLIYKLLGGSSRSQSVVDKAVDSYGRRPPNYRYGVVAKGFLWMVFCHTLLCSSVLCR